MTSGEERASQTKQERVRNSWTLRNLRRALTFSIASTVTALAFRHVPNQIAWSETDGIGSSLFLISLILLLIVVRVGTSDGVLDRVLHLRVEDIGESDLDLDLARRHLVALTGKDPTILEDVLVFLRDCSRYTNRITEEISLRRHGYTSSVTRTIVSPSRTPGETMLLPVMMPRKDLLIDGLTVSINGSSARTLSYLESQGLAARLLEVLFRACFQDKDDEGTLRSLQEMAARDEPAKRADVLDRLSRKLKSTEGIDEASRPSVLATRQLYGPLLETLSRQLADNYLLIVVCRSDGSSHLKVAVGRYIGTARPVENILDYLRLALGLLPRTHSFRIRHCADAPSYHLTIQFPDGLYVYDVEWALAGGGEGTGTDLGGGLSALDLPSPSPRRYRLRRARTEGMDYVHVYARGLNSAIPRLRQMHADAFMQLRVFLREEPPGLLLTVFLLSTYLTCLVWGVGHYYDLVFPDASAARGEPTDAGTTVSADARTSVSAWPTVLFGLPALVSGWLASRFTTSAMRTSSLPAVAVTLWTLVNAGSAVALAALRQSIPNDSEVDRVFGVVIHHVDWFALMLSTFVCTALVGVMLINRHIRYVVKNWRS